jgi:hypothetical protein
MPGVGRRRYGHSHGAVERYNCASSIFYAKAALNGRSLLSPRQSPAGLLAANLFCGQGQSLLSPRQSPEGLLAANLFRGQPGRSKHANTPNRRALSTTLSKLGRRMTHKSAPSGASTIPPPSCWKTFLFLKRKERPCETRKLPRNFPKEARWREPVETHKNVWKQRVNQNELSQRRHHDAGSEREIYLQHIAYIGTCVFYSINRN